MFKLFTRVKRSGFWNFDSFIKHHLNEFELWNVDLNRLNISVWASNNDTYEQTSWFAVMEMYSIDAHKDPGGLSLTLRILQAHFIVTSMAALSTWVKNILHVFFEEFSVKTKRIFYDEV